MNQLCKCSERRNEKEKGQRRREREKGEKRSQIKGEKREGREKSKRRYLTMEDFNKLYSLPQLAAHKLPRAPIIEVE